MWECTSRNAKYMSSPKAHGPSTIQPEERLRRVNEGLKGGLKERSRARWYGVRAGTAAVPASAADCERSGNGQAALA